MQPPFDHAKIARQLIPWHQQQQRDLPWRDKPAGERDAYTVWISEIMAQQTRLETVIGYFERWMVRFPTVYELAAADQQEVLKAWEGLGYYARARNLHRAAQIVVAEHDGVLPRERRTLLALPGIGAYTVGAILSIAFNQPEPILDGNVKRVLARLADIESPINETATLKQLWALSSAIVQAADVGRGRVLQRSLDGTGRYALHADRSALLDLPIGRTLRGSGQWYTGHPPC